MGVGVTNRDGELMVSVFGTQRCVYRVNSAVGILSDFIERDFVFKRSRILLKFITKQKKCIILLRFLFIHTRKTNFES